MSADERAGGASGTAADGAGGSCCPSLATFLSPDLFRALCDPTRLGLLARLATSRGGLRVGELGGCCAVDLSGVSRHLAILRDAGVLRSEREGREVRYHLDCRGLAGRLRGMAEALERCAEACDEEVRDGRGEVG